MNLNKMLIQDWTFREVGRQEWLPAKVPGCVHTDLLHNGQIRDPFYGTNEHDLQWIDKKDWEYKTVIEVTEEMYAEQQLDLVFEGLDTYANVYLNETQVLSADNMFRSWRIKVKSLLKMGSNTLRIVFRSPIQEDLPKLEALGYPLPATNDQSEVGGLGEKKLSIFARKAPYHYGWDWGPRFVTSGIWRPVSLEAWSGVRISDVFIRQDEVSAPLARLTAQVTFETDASFSGILTVKTEDSRWSKELQVSAGKHTAELPLDIEQPKLWWSRGLGEPHLYTFKAELKGAQTSAEASVRTGLRSAKLIRKKDQEGTSFYIELNGTPVFAKGANHIPNDSFQTEVTTERYRHEIASAAESNMNMLRVWGGGIYEEAAFYELCDEYGMMVWQDFMFACSMYPGDPTFLESVKLEAEDNVVRLRNHPSIVLWCGNNEIDTAWSHYDEHGGWGWKKDYSAAQRERIWKDYEAIFHEVLPKAVSSYAPGMDYWPSSPMVSLTGDISQHAHSSTTSGDIHYWGVWHNTEPFSNYEVHVGRFMSEYGFQSFPEPRTVRTYAEESDMELESKVMLAHQKNGAGNRLIKSYMDQYMNEPKDFEAFLHMSQMLQADAMKTAIEAHRRRMPYCMGTLYWQMNDCWPVASWAGMDYLGRWKALQYTAKRCFRDLSLIVHHQEGEQRLEVYGVSDLREETAGHLELCLMDLQGNVLWRDQLDILVQAQQSSILYEIDAAELLSGQEAGRVVLQAELKQQDMLLDSKTFYFVHDRDLQLEQSEISVTAITENGQPAYRLECRTLARHVWLTTEQEGIFSDNDFDLVPGQPKVVTFSRRSEGAAPFEPASAREIQVLSMVDCIQTVSPVR
ncbi:glycoside hydrolase family 2 TIM barrel [Paenibacillus algicola]|uniref:Beta-mannosidase n=1 Tax=Paenibacillus algicola TaxID=2565926 RepID=A0A4P8XGZ5_9BACL|nr:glycoside hydrolase family 2 protein [Paenibacillus algicola]QCT01766.1 glycoside hydrolase family 2 TIM barrel [Paenibacillus algicola]